MIPINIRDEDRAAAKKIADRLKPRFRGREDSILRGEGLYWAKLGELIVAEKFGWNHIDSADSDMYVPMKAGGGVSVEVKTKHRTVVCRPNYNGTVAAANTSQRCDYYLFCSTQDDDILFIVSIIAKAEFYKLSTFNKKGEQDPERPGWDGFKADCYNLKYGDMVAMDYSHPLVLKKPEAMPASAPPSQKFLW